MGRRKTNNRKLSVYLIKEEHTSFDQVVKPDLWQYIVRQAGRTIGTLYVKPPVPRPPAWLSFFDGALDGELYLESSLPSAVFLLRQAGRVFAITFGYGRNLLRPGAWEDRFGLKVVLNSVDPSRLRVIDRKSLDTMLTHTRTQTSRESPLQEFGLDVQQVLLKAVTGKPEDRDFAASVSGADALSITCEAALGTVEAKCRGLLDAFTATRYETAFPWVNNVSEVANKQAREELDGELTRRMAAGETEGLFLAVPEILEWSGIDGFRFTREGEPTPDILLSDFLHALPNPDALSPDLLRRKRVSVVHSDTGISEPRWSVYHCLNCEITRDRNTYILTEGKWYDVNTSFLDEVNSRVEMVQRRAVALSAGVLEKEADYCTRLCAAEGVRYALMDRSIVRYGGGNSQIEVCDLFDTNRTFVHLKRYASSSVLSHLFNQGTNSARAFLTDPGFRAIVFDRLPETHRCFDPQQRPTASDYEVMFGIISRRADELPAKLPFFSKITLMRVLRELEEVMRYRVSLAGIRVAQ